jgi:dephospho-CoA kinase
MLIVGLTGGIGSGKSTVAGLLAARGAEVIDVDGLGRQVLQPGGRAAAPVVAEFGPGVVAPDGSIDRAALAAVVFADADALARLTAISHPAIDAELVDLLRAMPDQVIAVLDMAVLAESTLGRNDERYHYTFVVTVEAPAELREDRAVARGADRADVRRRMTQQASDADRRRLADVVIVNDGTLAQLTAQVEALWAQLRSLAGDPGPAGDPGT